eukprot:SAG31_NODE_3531_length_4151_cov_2.125864_5_plen_48_part_00
MDLVDSKKLKLGQVRSWLHLLVPYLPAVRSLTDQGALLGQVLGAGRG